MVQVMRKFVLLVVILFCVVSGVSHVGAAEPYPEFKKASWLWTGPAPVAVGEWECYTRWEFELAGEPVVGQVLITADNLYELYVNGKMVGEDGGAASVYWQSLELYDITKLLNAGKNVIAARGKSLGGSAAVPQDHKRQ